MTGRQPTDADVLRQDLSELMELAGMDDFARPVSPHAVFQEALGKIRAKLDSPHQERPQGMTTTIHYSGPVVVEVAGQGTVTVTRDGALYRFVVETPGGYSWQDACGSQILAFTLGGMALQRLAVGRAA